MQVMSKIIRYILDFFTCIVGVILLITMYAWVQVHMLGADFANVLGYTVFDVVTGSMSGTIEIDDYIIVKQTKNINLNDIITFKQDDDFITHRVVQINGDKIITRGDANNADDVDIVYDQIVGKVIKIIPNGGVWKNVITDPKVLVAVFITLVLFILAFSVEEKRLTQVTRIASLDRLNSIEEERFNNPSIFDVDKKKNKNKKVSLSKVKNTINKKPKEKTQKQVKEVILQEKKVKANLDALK